MPATTSLVRALENRQQNCLLFTGAGFSRGVPATGAGVPAGSELRADFNEALGGTKFSLQVASYEYLERFGSESYVAFLRKRFALNAAPAIYEHLRRRPWTRIYTTNYDNLSEEALKTSPSNILSPLNSQKPSFQIAEIVHINGFIGHLNIDNCARDFKLKFDDYDSSVDENILYMLQRDLAHCGYVIFCGYSLYDLDVRRALSVAGLNKEQVFFITKPDVDEEDLSIFQRYGQVLNVGVEGFLELLGKLETPAAALEEALQAPENFEVFTKEPAGAVISNEEVFRIYTAGGPEARHFQANQTQPKIVVERDAVISVLAAFENGEKRIAIHSNIGNGKSAVIQNLMLRLSGANIVCYTYTGGSRIGPREISYFKSRRQAVCLVFDGDLISPKTVMDYADRLPQCLIIYGLRSVHIELRRSGGWEKLQDFSLHDLNGLKKGEVQQLTSIFETYGLWGSYGDREQRNLFASGEADFRSVMLQLFKNERIQKAIGASVKEILADHDYIRDVYVLVLLLSYLGLRPSNAYIQRLSGISALSEFVKVIQQDDEIAENVRYANGEFRYYSSIYSEFVLKNLVRDADKTEVMLKVFAKSEFISIDVIKSLRVSLTRFGAVNPVFADGPFKSSSVIGYYDALSRMQSLSKDFLFWLQFAIACNAFEKFDLAGRYFNTAYKYAEGADPYQIDNHYAKFLLKSRESRPDQYNDFYEAFEEAHKKSLEQFRVRDEAKFPLEVFAMYGGFLQSHSRRFTAEQKSVALVIISELKEEIVSRKFSDFGSRAKGDALQSLDRGSTALRR